MRILVASSSPPDRGSGISTYCRELTKGLKASGHEIIYASPMPTDFSWLKENTNAFIETPFVRNMDDLVRRVVGEVNAHNIDAVINSDNAVIQNLAPILSAAFISVGHLESTTIRQMLCHNLAWTDYVVAISSDMQMNLMKKLKLPPHRVPLIHNGLFDALTQKTKVNEAKLKVIYGGGFVRRKGGDKILRLLDIAKFEENIEFEIFGELRPSLKNKLETICNANIHGRTSREVFLKSLTSADIFLLPSRSEGCPMALLEAMSAGCVPVVSNGSGAMRWIVQNGGNGYVARLERWEFDTSQILKFLEQHPAELARLSANAQTTFKQEYTVENTVNKLLHLLQNPTVSRVKLPEKVDLIHWHRWPNSSIKQRIYYRLGILETFGSYIV